MGYCAIFQCNANTNHLGGTNYFTVPHESTEKLKPNKNDGFGTFVELRRVSFRCQSNCTEKLPKGDHLHT